ncbi:hypothetical protein CL628_03420 [bacterium]|nr:hypothetical protein [bacterium]
MLFRKIGGWVIPGIGPEQTTVLAHAISPPALEGWLLLVMTNAPADGEHTLAGFESSLEGTHEKVPGSVLLGSTTRASRTRFNRLVHQLLDRVEKAHVELARGQTPAEPVIEFIRASWKGVGGEETFCFDCAICYEFERPNE